LLLDHLGINKKLYLLRAATGGSTALYFALSYPERTEDVAVMSSILRIKEPEYRAIQKKVSAQIGSKNCLLKPKKPTHLFEPSILMV